MLKKIIPYIVISLFLTSSLDASTGLSFEDVLQDYRQTLPSPPLEGESPEITALRATTFVLGFLGEREKNDLSSSIKTIDPFHPLDSVQSLMTFHHYYTTQEGAFALKTERDKRVGQLYRTLLKCLHEQTPLIGYLYGSAFKSASVFNHKTGKVLSRRSDLQERLEYEAYAHLQKGLCFLGIPFHVVILRDVFHAYALDLSSKEEKITPLAPEITSYGHEIANIAKQANVTVLELSDLKDLHGCSFEFFIQGQTTTLAQRATTLAFCDLKGLSGFFEKEYEHEKGTKREKSARASERARRYLTLKGLVKENEHRFMINSFLDRFGSDAAFVPFSIHVEDYLKSCEKLPLRPLSRFRGGCNPQHQLPLLQRKATGQFIFYSVRADVMKKILARLGTLPTIQVGGYETFYYEGDQNLDTIK